MNNAFSILPRIKPNKGKAQWLQARYVRSEASQAERVVTHFMEVPHLMPGTIIFVHGVNSEGEWYRDAAKQFCEGLNMRLGRQDLNSGDDVGYNDKNKRFVLNGEGGSRYLRPIIPFYWGYKLKPGDLDRYPGIYHEEDMAWGGGPFQNGTTSLLEFWQGGFRRELLAGMVDLQELNPEIDRQLQDAPPRTYFIHAARRLANLIDTIREDFPNEPINVVAHSQGNMITLCAMLYMKQRAPDTLILNNAPYAFDDKFTDKIKSKNGSSEVQSSIARDKTFIYITEIVERAKTDFKDEEACEECGHEAIPGHASMHVHHAPGAEDWHAQIGCGVVNDRGHKWHECSHAGRDNRGKVFVNFSPHDRVIGVSAIAGIGWRGIPERLLGEGRKLLPNVHQRVFVRNSGFNNVPAVGERDGYWFSYFIEKAVTSYLMDGFDQKVTAGEGSDISNTLIHEYTFDGKDRDEFWNPPPNKVLKTISVQDTPSIDERVWINAPTVPHPAQLGEDFDLGKVRFDGVGVDDDGEQAKDFANFKRFYVPKKFHHRYPDGSVSTRRETPEEIEAKMRELGAMLVPQTDHGQILRYGKENGQGRPVEQVLSYDLTVGQGYAFGDEAYWQYLLGLADWKISDPYYHTGQLPAPGDYPPGLDPRTVG